MKSLDKYRGCLIGGAAGDALGYPVEFLNEHEISSRYASRGITVYELVDGVAQISDDTQMTLFTAAGLLFGTTRGMVRGIMGGYPSYVALSYRDWLSTQTKPYPLDTDDSYANCLTWLVNVPELFSRRAPGNTCLSALRSGKTGAIDKPINNSKGCGGVMRVAPVGLYFAPGDRWVENPDLVGAEVAAITHGHELGYMPAATLTHIIRLLAHEDVSIRDAVISAIEATKSLFPDARHLPAFVDLMERAVELANENAVDLDAIHSLGEGWVAEETLAVAVYCAIKHPDDFEAALVAAVNHNGDSDSTGAVTGNIMGAHLELSGIPDKFIENLELKDVILEVADDLYNDCQMEEFGDYEDEVWTSKYIYHTYPKAKEV